MTDTEFMRRIQWARFMSVPVTLTEDEAKNLLFAAVSDSDYDDVYSEAEFWHTRGRPDDRLAVFMLDEEDRPFYDWDADAGEWVENARSALFDLRLDVLRDEFNADWKSAAAKYGRWGEAVDRLKTQIAAIEM